MFSLLKSTLYTALIALAAVSLSLSASAQSIPGITEPVSFVVSPQFPEPGGTVTITAQSFSTDLNRASFTWYVNGKVYKKGTGITQISVGAGKSGALTSVSVNVITDDIGTIENETSFRPATVSLLWKTDGYTPPFYKGKALEAYGSGWIVTAVPEFVGANGKRVDPKTLLYTWKKNGNVDASQSGYGKDTFTGMQSSFVRGGDDITVEVSDSSRSMAAQKTITISPVGAEIVLYENSPLYGFWFEKAMSGTFDLAAEEISLYAVPFNMSVSNPLSGFLSFDWNLNGSDVPAFKDQTSVTLRKTGDSGQSQVGVTVQHKTKILQGGQANVTILQ